MRRSVLAPRQRRPSRTLRAFVFVCARRATHSHIYIYTYTCASTHAHRDTHARVSYTLSLSLSLVEQSSHSTLLVASARLRQDARTGKQCALGIRRRYFAPRVSRDCQRERYLRVPIPRASDDRSSASAPLDYIVPEFRRGAEAQPAAPVIPRWACARRRPAMGPTSSTTTCASPTRGPSGEPSPTRSTTPPTARYSATRRSDGVSHGLCAPNFSRANLNIARLRLEGKSLHARLSRKQREKKKRVWRKWWRLTRGAH